MYTMGIDVGGTFTDLICVDREGNITVSKAPTTPKDPSIGMMGTLQKCSEYLGITRRKLCGEADIIVHGSTAATNALLTFTGAKVGLLTTKGHRDVLEIREGIRDTWDNFDVRWQPPPMIVPRRFRIGIEERIKWDGSVYIPLNEKDVHDAIKIFKENKIDSIAVCYLWSFMNPMHEIRTREIIQQEYPEAWVWLSSEILPVIREYPRVSTTVVSAFIGPNLSEYLVKVSKLLTEEDYTKHLLIMLANGGVATHQTVIQSPAYNLYSGPAAGPMAGIYYCDVLGIENVITVDMGGTSFDVGLVKNKTAVKSTERMMARYDIGIPVIDVHSIGAGGGSIAWIDPRGILQVGPQSAGAEPGPACYLKGGEHPTATDADLVLGYLNPDYFLGGEIRLDIKAAIKAIKEKVADPLGKDITEAAYGIFNTINMNMVDAIRLITVERGEDPKEYNLIVAGGAGSTHCAYLAREMKIPRVIIPRISSVFCALGGITTDYRHDFIQTCNVPMAKVSVDKLNELYQAMEAEGKRLLEIDGIAIRDMYFLRSADLFYTGQLHEVETPVPGGILIEKDISTITDRFHELHGTRFGWKAIELATEVMNLRVAACGKVIPIRLREQPRNVEDPSKALKTKRDVFFGEYGKAVPTPIYDGDKLTYGNVVRGPAILEQRITTIVVPPEFEVQVDKYGNFMMKVPI